MGLSPNDASGNVTVTFADAVVRVLGVELRGLCRLRQRAPDHQSTPVNFTKWDTQKAAGSHLIVRLCCMTQCGVHLRMIQNAKLVHHVLVRVICFGVCAASLQVTMCS